MSRRITKANKPFTIEEELILPACTDICSEVLGESAAEKIAQVPLSALTVAKQIEDIGADIDRGGVEDTRLEAKDTKKIPGQAKDSLSEDRHSRGQGQECSRPRTQAQVLSKRKK